MRRFVYLVRPAFDRAFLSKAGPKERAVADRHGDYLVHLAERGKLLFAGRCADGPFGIVLLEASDEEEARMLMQTDPSIQSGVLTAELYPFDVLILRG